MQHISGNYRIMKNVYINPSHLVRVIKAIAKVQGIGLSTHFNNHGVVLMLMMLVIKCILLLYYSAKFKADQADASRKKDFVKKIKVALDYY